MHQKKQILTYLVQITTRIPENYTECQKIRRTYLVKVTARRIHKKQKNKERATWLRYLPEKYKKTKSQKHRRIQHSNTGNYKKARTNCSKELQRLGGPQEELPRERAKKNY